MGRQRPHRWLALGLAAAMFVAGCGDDDDSTTESDSSSADKEPILVPVINQEDGVTAFPDEGQAVQAIFDWYNAEGGLDGHPLEVDLCTAGDDPESTQACAREVANNSDAQFVFPAATPNSAAMLDTMKTADKPVVGDLLWDVPDWTSSDLYSTDPGTLPLIEVLAQFAADNLGIENIAIVYADQAAYKGARDLVAALMENHGIQSTFVPFDAGTADFLPVVQSADLDAVDGLAFLPTDASVCVPAAQALQASGFDKPVLAGDQCSSDKVVNAGETDGWYIPVSTSGLVEGNPDRDQLLEIFEEFDGPEIGGLVPPVAMNAFYVIDILEAANESGEITADSIRAAAEEFTGPLFLGPESMSCPGPKPFLAVCNQASKMIRLEDGAWVDAIDFQTVDMKPLADLIG